MNYKLIEDKNGTIILNEKRYKMSKLEYTKDDLIDIQNDYDLLYKKLDHYNKIINEQALEIARLKEQLTMLVQDDERHQEIIIKLGNKIDKTIKYINKKLLPYGDDWHWDDAGIRYYVEELLKILGDKK